MDIVEFAEKFLNVELQEWQKIHLRTLDKLGKDADVRIIMPRHHGERQVYIYMDNIKELMTHGTPNDC